MQNESDRISAVKQLRRIARDRAYRSLVSSGSSPRTVEIVATVTRWRRWIDFQLVHFCRSSPGRLEPLVAEVLRAGIGEMIVLRTPAFAAVHSWVVVARAMVRPQAARLVNAVLRRVAEQLDDLPEPQTQDPVRNLAIRWSHPTWLAKKYVRSRGVQVAIKLMKANNRAPNHYVRVNTLKTDKDDFECYLAELGIGYEQASYLKNYYHVSRLSPIVRAGLLQQGLCAVHDQSAGLVVRLLDPQPGESVLDACAAPGGKTCQIAQRMSDRGCIAAWDVHPGRADRIRKAIRDHNLRSVRVACRDLRTAPAMEFDRVLVDVPCTGTGVLAKRADLRWQRTPKDLTDLISLQDTLLEAAARHVRPGGRLVYSTCSIEPEENERCVYAFLTQYPNFRLIPAAGIVPDDVMDDSGFLATLPYYHRTDGAFAACLQRGGHDD